MKLSTVLRWRAFSWSDTMACRSQMLGVWEKFLESARSVRATKKGGLRVGDLLDAVFRCCALLTLQ